MYGTQNVAWGVPGTDFNVSFNAFDDLMFRLYMNTYCCVARNILVSRGRHQEKRN
jgi:hypothetical protein